MHDKAHTYLILKSAISKLDEDKHSSLHLFPVENLEHAFCNQD